MNTNKIEFIYLNHYNYFLIVAFNICHNRELAKDIVQEGFIKILGSQETFIDIPHARRYLTGCVKNAAFKVLNEENRIKAMRHDFVHTENELPNFYSLLQKLKPVTRIILKEIYFNSKSQHSISVQYKISPFLIRSQHRKGLLKLKTLL